MEASSPKEKKILKIRNECINVNYKKYIIIYFFFFYFYYKYIRHSILIYFLSYDIIVKLE